MPHDRARHAADRPRSRDQHILAQHREGEGGVHGIPERIEDRRDVLVDARSVVPDVRHRQRDQLGKGTRPVDPDTLRVSAQVAPAGHAVAAASADDMALAADQVADVKVVHVRPHRDDLAHELVPDHQRHRDRPLRPGIPSLDVHVGAADAGPVHPDQHVVDAVLGLGHLLQPQAGLGAALDQCAHAAPDPRWIKPASTRSATAPSTRHPRNSPTSR
jgi:hypothetical protein